MAYKKYIKVGGKTYGPYVYHSRKVNGKVVSDYYGRDFGRVKTKKNKNLRNSIIGILFVLGFFVVLAVFGTQGFYLNNSLIESVISELIIKEKVYAEDLNLTTDKNIIIVNKTLINATIQTAQFQAVLNKPVRWKKNIILDKKGVVKVKIPKQATNISVIKLIDFVEETNITEIEENISEIPIEKPILNETSSVTNETNVTLEEKTNFTEGEEVVENIDEIPKEKPEKDKEKDKIKQKEYANFTITEKIIYENEEKFNLIQFFKNYLTIFTGKVANVEEREKEKEVTIDDNSTEYEILYETQAPYAVEEPLEKGKRVKIIGPELVHYENVLAFTNLSESLGVKNPDKVKIHWVENNTFLPTLNVLDSNNNGIYDYVSWIAPELSNQTFDIIVITNAEHLNSNRQFISDIFEQVKALDDIWSETIPNGDYVRVTFERNLTSDRDITIYPRIVNGSPRVEVYEFNKSEVITEFTSITSKEYNKALLTNLTGSQDVFDLKIIGGSIEFDHIVDPITNVTTCQTLNTTGETYVLQNNITGIVGTCFTITADNITLDGNGFIIDGDDSGTDSGVTADTQDNLTVKNFFNITDFRYGIYFDTTNNSLITNNTVDSNPFYGIYLRSSSNNTVTNNAAISNTQGIYLYVNSNNNQITNNTANSNFYGIMIESSSNNNQVTNNTANSNENGIYILTNSNNNQVTNNTFNSNDGDGIFLDSSLNNILTNNIVTSSGGDGISLYFNSLNNTVTNNTVNLSTFAGIALYPDSNNNQVTDNTANSNTWNGIQLFESSNNTITDNTANSNTGSGIELSSNSNNNQLLNNEITNNTNNEILDDTGNLYTNYLIYNNSFGEISWTDTTNGSFLKNLTLIGDIGLNINLTIGNDTAYLNTSAFTLGSINSSANVTLYGMDSFSFTDPQIQKDGVECTECYNFTLLNASTVKFNVTSWSNYTLGESPSDPTPPDDSTPPSQGGGSGGTVTPFSGIQLDKDKIGVTLKQRETKSEELIITNLGTSKIKIDLEISGVLNFLKLSEESFDLNVGENKTVTLNFFAGENTLPDLYAGKLIIKTGDIVKEVLIAVEIESQGILLNILMEIPESSLEIETGKEFLTNVTLFSLGGLGKTDVFLEYSIMDIDYNSIIMENETITVETRTNFVKKFTIPEYVNSGNYIFYIKATYDGKSASASSWFFISASASSWFFINKKGIGISIIILINLLLVILTIIVYKLIKIYQKMRESQRLINVSQNSQEPKVHP